MKEQDISRRAGVLFRENIIRYRKYHKHYSCHLKKDCNAFVEIYHSHHIFTIRTKFGYWRKKDVIIQDMKYNNDQITCRKEGKHEKKEKFETGKKNSALSERVRAYQWLPAIRNGLPSGTGDTRAGIRLMQNKVLPQAEGVNKHRIFFCRRILQAFTKLREVRSGWTSM